VIIISQKSVNNDILFLKKYIIIHNEPENISKCVDEVLNNYEYYYHLMYDNFDENQYYNFIMENFEKFLNF
jgi:hypothetical protein